MSGLREAAERIARIGRYPTPSSDRLLHCEKAAAKLADRETGVLDSQEEWDDFLRRIGVIAA